MENIQMEKRMEKEKNIIFIMVSIYLLENLIMEKDGTDMEKNIILKGNWYLMVNMLKGKKMLLMMFNIYEL